MRCLWLVSALLLMMPICMVGCASHHPAVHALGMDVEQRMDERGYSLRFTASVPVRFFLEQEKDGKVFDYFGRVFEAKEWDPYVLFIGDIPDSVRIRFEDGKVVRFKPRMR